MDNKLFVSVHNERIHCHVDFVMWGEFSVSL